MKASAARVLLTGASGGIGQAMAKALLEVTNWRRDKDSVEFIGPTTFRFRLSTH